MRLCLHSFRPGLLAQPECSSPQDPGDPRAPGCLEALSPLPTGAQVLQKPAPWSLSCQGPWAACLWSPESLTQLDQSPLPSRLPRLEEGKPAAGPRGREAARGAWPRPLTAGCVRTEQPVQRGGPGRGGAQHALRRHAALLHVPATRPHREARLQVDPPARHVLLRGLLSRQLLRQLVRAPSGCHTRPAPGASRDRVPYVPSKMPQLPT